MDDVRILASTRWKLKRAIRVLNETFNELKLEKHPNKTAMGITEKGFDFLGFHFSPEGLSVAEKAKENFLAHTIRLYELEHREPSGSLLLGLYVRRWERRVRRESYEILGSSRVREHSRSRGMGWGTYRSGRWARSRHHSKVCAERINTREI